MPVNAPLWASNQALSAKKLNTDLYSYVPGNAYTPNGILFHTRRPLLFEYVYGVGSGQALASSVAGSFNTLKASTTALNSAMWSNVWDSAAYFGPGGDYAGANNTIGSNQTGVPLGTVSASVPGASGFPDAGVSSGNGFYWLSGTVVVGVFSGTNTNQVFGCGLSFNQSNTAASPLCCCQLGSAAHDNAAFMLDLFHIDNAANNFGIGGYGADSAGNVTNAYHTDTNPSDWSGEQNRMFSFWASIDDAARINSEYGAGNGVLYGVQGPGAPTPPSTFTGASAITSANLNSQVVNTLNFLHGTPLLRVGTIVNQAVPNANADTKITISQTTSPQPPEVDTWAGWSDATNTYTVPVSGVYLVHGAVSWAPTAAASFNVQAGIAVGANTYWGPGYQTTASASAGTGTIATVTRLMDLNAGDTVQLHGRHNSGAGNASTWSAVTWAPCRLVMQWLGALGVPSTLWTVPDPDFRWQAGTPGSTLVTQFNSHLVNDLGFLVNRPYLLSWQSVVAASNTGVAANAQAVVVMDQVAGRVHASTGDNYSGWTSGAANKYTCQRTGWYLVVGEYTIATNASTPYPIAAQVVIPNAQAHSNTWWGQHISTTSGSTNPGATFLNVQYLRAGDTIQPAAMVQPANNTNTWATAVPARQESHFGLIWLSQ